MKRKFFTFLYLLLTGYLICCMIEIYIESRIIAWGFVPLIIMLLIGLIITLSKKNSIL